MKVDGKLRFKHVKGGVNLVNKQNLLLKKIKNLINAIKKYKIK